MGGRADVAAMLESHVNRRFMNKLMGILTRLAGEARRGMARHDEGRDRGQGTGTGQRRRRPYPFPLFPNVTQRT